MNAKRRIILRRLVRERDGDLCWLCGEEMVFKPTTPLSARFATLDHVRPLSKGGRSQLDNLHLAHQDCNVRRQADESSGHPSFWSYVNARKGK
jgi:5-methylcytosine-specific restriction endonuclease McrA